TRGRITNEGTWGHLRIIRRAQSPGINLNRPQGNEGNDYKQDVAVSPAEPFIGADAMALLAAVGVVMNLRATGGTVHGLFSPNSLDVVSPKTAVNALCIFVLFRVSSILASMEWGRI